jgi:hypothetical protein
VSVNFDSNSLTSWWSSGWRIDASKWEYILFPKVTHSGIAWPTKLPIIQFRNSSCSNPELLAFDVYKCDQIPAHSSLFRNCWYKIVEEKIILIDRLKSQAEFRNSCTTGTARIWQEFLHFLVIPEFRFYVSWLRMHDHVDILYIDVIPECAGMTRNSCIS